MALVDLKMSKKDMAEEMKPAAMEPSPYPHGLCIRLDGDELDKLGITALPSVGDYYHIEAVGCVTSVSEMNRQDSESRQVEVQIEQMEVESVAEEEAEGAEAGEVEGANSANTVVRSTYRG